MPMNELLSRLVQSLAPVLSFSFSARVFLQACGVSCIGAVSSASKIKQKTLHWFHIIFIVPLKQTRLRHNYVGTHQREMY